MSLSHWARFLVLLAAETALLTLTGALLAFWLRSPHLRRTLWRTALIAVSLVWIVEISGLRARIPAANPIRYRFTSTATVPPTSASPTDAEAHTPQKPDSMTPIADMAAIKWPVWIWSGGCGLLLGRLCVMRVWLALRQRRATAADPITLEWVAEQQGSFGLRAVRCQVWPSLRSPVAFGIFRPTIALPRDVTARFSAVEREAMLAHEMAHLAAHDPVWLLVIDAVVALAWWHPMVWWARRELQFANEAAADEASGLVAGGSAALAECLVRLGRELASGGPARGMGVEGTGLRSQLARRIENLLRGPGIWRPTSFWMRWTPQAAGILTAAASVLLPIQPGLGGSIFALLAASGPARAESPPTAAPVIEARSQISTSSVSNVTFSVAATGTSPLTYQWLFNGSNVINTNAASVPADAQSPPNPAPSSAGKQFAIIDAVGTPSVQSKPNGSEAGAASGPSNSGGAEPGRKVSLTIETAILEEKDADNIGLDWVLGPRQTEIPAPELSDDWKVLRQSPPIHGKRLVIDRIRFHDRAQSAVLKPEQYAALRDRIVRQSDILTAPVSLAESGLKARFAVQRMQTTVTDVDANAGDAGGGATVRYTTDDIALGLAVEVVPRYEGDGKWSLDVQASQTSFVGYDDYGRKAASVSAPGGKPIQYQVPHPHFRSVEADAHDTLLPGQTLAMRGPVWTETIKTKGHFLIPAKTKTIQQRLYIFATPGSVAGE